MPRLQPVPPTTRRRRRRPCYSAEHLIHDITQTYPQLMTEDVIRLVFAYLRVALKEFEKIELPNIGFVSIYEANRFGPCFKFTPNDGLKDEVELIWRMTDMTPSKRAR